MAGCAMGTQGPEVEDARIARLPPEDREALLEERRDLDRISTNVDTMEVAVEEAEQFRGIVERERQAAELTLEAAQEASELAELAGDRKPAEDARERERIAEAHLGLAQEKSRYADALVELRQTQARELEAKQELAQARLERARFERLQARDMQGDLDAEEFAEAEERAEEDLEEARERASTLRSQVDARARRWEQVQQEVQANGLAEAPPIEPPEPPQLLDAEVPEPPPATETGDATE